MIKIDAMIKGVAAYVDRELLPQLNDLHRFAVATYKGMLLADMQSTVAAIARHPLLLLPGFTTDDGKIDIDKAYTAARDALTSYPLNVHIAGVNLAFRQGDVDKLYAYIKEYSNEM